ncbi:RNA methyltransferase [Actibacterium sp. 188UL27-1]|uniref:RNA methyltransferase n=1 Tax=Actibacterium sp. 188UL27-1 TaxID=2786961 RepID=UPI001957BA2F|nr:RNA methyltransferase [Actibacterium sp. 188UL27-1]MBM7067600.1 RNA methyltransferase [Actibacterium sp. 188UL27-1]
MPEPVFILVRPQMGENIGGAARAMWNFGLSRMRLVDPRDGWPNQRAVALASGAGRLLDGASVHGQLPDAIHDCTYVFATTARSRDLTKPVFTPEQAMAQARDMAGAGQNVGILFGPERAGLENEDVARANAIITVPVNPQFFSLNLAQCVLLMAYEWGRRSDAVTQPAADVDLATGIEVEKLGDHYEERLGEAGFFFPDSKADGMKTVLRNMWGRLPLTRSDVQMLHGMLRQLLRNPPQGPRP